MPEHVRHDEGGFAEGSKRRGWAFAWPGKGPREGAGETAQAASTITISASSIAVMVSVSTSLMAAPSRVPTRTP